MRGVQDPATNNAQSTEKVLLEQLAQASRASNAAGVHNIDPAIAGHVAPPPPPPPAAMMDTGSSMMDTDDGSGEKKGLGKRELSTSKRAAQNRAAQRAFRQRKETHIKKLEEQVRDYNLLADAYKRLQNENFQLRDYIVTLQSNLVESQGSFPPPPSNIDLHAPREEGLPPSLAAASSTGAGVGPGAADGNSPSGDAAPTASAAAAAAAPTAPMDSSQLQASAAQAVARGQQETSIEQRTDPALTDA